MKLPTDLGPIHFVGIGGIGMSGIAEVLHNLDYKVQGSDLSDSANVQRLRAKGISVRVGHAAEAVEDADVVVISSAVKRDNPELQAARAAFKPVVRRAEMLAELMRLKTSVAVAGTHGKTTTTSLVATLFEAGGLDPTVINGGIINAYGTNARLGGSEWMVVEADESDGTFVKLPADIAIVTNIDPEHLDHYGTFDGLRAAFCQFVENLPFYGFAAMCLDHPEVQALVGRIEDRRILTYGENPQADVRVVDIEPKGRRTRFSILLRDRRQGTERRIEALELPMAGLHNVLNATAAIAVAIGVGIGDEAIRKGLSGFEGVKRRFTPMGGYNGIEVFDDYAHHPVEIAAALKAARSAGSGKIIAVVQPHRYSRLKNLFDGFCSCFNDADIVIVAPVYEAGESPIEGASRDDLVAGLRARGHRQVIALDGPDDLARLIADKAAPGDMVVCLGAGSVTNWAAALPGQLDALGEGTGA